MLRKLADRELTGGGSFIQPFAKIPPSMMSRIEDVEDEERQLRGCILLGFTRDGCHVVSYTTGRVAAADGQPGLCLQLWARVGGGGRLCRAWSVPLFRTGPYKEAVEEEGAGVFGPDLDMSITVAEAPDASLLVVHGRTTDARELASHDSLPNYVTLIPGPLLSSARHLRAAHLCYYSAHPHPPWNPFACLVPVACGVAGAPGGSGGDSGSSSSSSRTGGSGSSSSSAGGSGSSSSGTVAQHAVGLFLVHCLRYVYASPRLRPWDGDHGGAGSSIAGGSSSAEVEVCPSGAEEESSEIKFSLSLEWSEVDCWRAGQRRAPAGAATRGAAGGAGPDSGTQEAPLPAARGSLAEVVLSAPPHECDVEGRIYGALVQSGISLSALRDYAAVPVAPARWCGHEGTLVLALLRLHFESEGHEASAVALLHASVSDGGGRTVGLLRPPYPWQGDVSSDMVHQLALAGVGFAKAAFYFAEFMRSQQAPPASRAAVPLALSNKTVLAGGPSLKYIAHPWLPHAIVQWGA